jgi:flagellin
VIASQDASQSIDIDQSDLGALTTSLNITTLSNGATPANITTINAAIQSLATMRATNGAQQSRLSFAADLLAVNKVNLEAANGRIIDVDVASESANLARFSILQQAGTAMLAQANQSSQSILALLT